MNEYKSRRSFLGKTVLAGGMAATTKASVSESKVSAPNIITRPAVDLIKIGVIALGDNSHMNYSIFTPMINPTEPDIWPMRTTRMVITHCWDSRPDVADAFAKKYNCEAVKNYKDMVGKVDGMMFGGFNEAKWWPQLTKPYLEAGIPCYINRPLAYSMKAAKEIIETAKKNNAPLYCVDEREFFKEAVVARIKCEELIREKKNILGANSDNSAGYEFPQHGIHGLYFLLAIFGLDVAQVSLIADGWWREKIKTSANPMNYGLLSLQYRGMKIDGAGEQTKPFVVTQQQLTGYDSNSNIRIHYDGGWFDCNNRWEQGEPMNRLYYYFYFTIIMMQKMFETRQMPFSYDYYLKKTQIFLTGFRSHLEFGGAMTPVDDLPDEWEAPCPYPDWIDESIFK
jgi:predicted dehydrogenase